jgi:hypothetical protein
MLVRDQDQDKEIRHESWNSQGGGRNSTARCIESISEVCKSVHYDVDYTSAILNRHVLRIAKGENDDAADPEGRRSVNFLSLHSSELPDWVNDNRYFLEGDRRACLKGHISGNGCFELYGHENYSGIKYRSLAINEGESGGGKKAEIKEFTRKSRKNFLRRTSDINWKKIPRDRQYLITLTYEIEAYKQYENDGRAVKNQLDVFFRELGDFMKCYKVAWSAVWVLEFQKNTHNPHFHMVVILDKNIHSKGRTIWLLRQWIKPTWSRIIGGSEKSERVGTDVQGIKHSVIGYFAKYCGKEGIQKKVPEGYEGIGRFWGIRGRKALPWLEIISVLIEYEEGVMVKRLIRQFLRKRKKKRMKARGDPRSALLCFGVNVSNLTRLLEAGGVEDV